MSKTDNVIVSHRLPDPPSSAERATAVRVVAASAHDAADCALLLNALDLHPAEGRGETQEEGT